MSKFDATPVVALHPDIANDYRKQIDSLHDARNTNEAAKLEAAPKLRALINHIVLRPTETQRDVVIDVVGHLDQVIGLATGADLDQVRIAYTG